MTWMLGLGYKVEDRLEDEVRRRCGERPDLSQQPHRAHLHPVHLSTISTLTIMSSIIKLLSTLVFLFHTVHSLPAKCNPNRADKCAADLFVFGHSNLTLPHTLEALGDHCKARFSAVRCVQNYIKECLKLFPKQVASLLVKGAANNAKMQCKTDREEFMERGKCLKENRGGLNRCMKKLIKQLSIAEKKSEKVVLTCCLFKEYRDCNQAVLEKDQTSCTKQDVKYFNALVEGNAADVFDLVCRSQKLESPKTKTSCLPVDEKELKKSKKPLSLFLPFVNIFSE